MTEYPYSYTFALDVDDSIFDACCSMLEKNLVRLKKEKLLIDVDGSETQVYYWNGQEIIVHNSCYVGAVYVESQMNLLPYFDKPPVFDTSST